jgi:DHA1 family tetracycline resistance protein-like MFS transporter
MTGLGQAGPCLTVARAAPSFRRMETMSFPPAKPVSRHAVTFVLLTVLLDMVGFGLIIPVLPALIEEVGQVSLADASIIGGWMFFAFSVAQFAFSPLMGNLSDRFGRRPLLLLAIAGLGIDYILQAFAPTLLWLFVGRAIAGFCGSSWIIANAYLTDITAPEDRAKAFGMMGAAFGVGFILGPALGGLLGEFGPRVPFFVAAAVSGANLVYGWFVLPETLPPENRRAFSWRRSNPFGAFKVFRQYKGVLPMCAVLFVFFFSSSVYPAIWPFWGIAKFGWSEAMVGLSLAVFGVVMAVFQGVLTGPAVKAFGEHRVALIGLVSAAIAAAGYGLAGSLGVVVVLMVVHGPEGFIHPMLTAMMTRDVPDNAQGELQGGIAAIMNVAMLGGTVFFSQVFGYFMQPGAPLQSPDIAYFLAAAGMGLALVLFVIFVRKDGQER